MSVPYMKALKNNNFVGLDHRVTGLDPVVLIGTRPLPSPATECVPPLAQSARFFSSRPNWDPPPPHPEASVSPLRFRGGHTRLRESGWGVPIRTRGQTLWYSRYVCT
jgi:hypothetical protein